MLNAHSKLKSFHPVPKSRFSPQIIPPREDKNHPGSSTTRGIHLRNLSGFSRQWSEPCKEAIAGEVGAVVHCPSGVRVEHFASVKRQPPQPIVPLMHRFARCIPRDAAIGSASRRDFSCVPNAAPKTDEVDLPQNRSTDSLGHEMGWKRPCGKPLLPLPSESPVAPHGLSGTSEIFGNSAIQNQKGFPKDFDKGNVHSLAERSSSKRWNISNGADMFLPSATRSGSHDNSDHSSEQKRGRGRCSSRFSLAGDTGQGVEHPRWASRKLLNNVGEELGSWRDGDPDVLLNDGAEDKDGGRKVCPLMSIRSFPLRKSYGEIFCWIACHSLG